GKTLNMSMLKCFFEIGCDRAIFDGLEIAGETELCETYMGKFPVIFISLKSVSGLDFYTARAILCTVIGKEALRFHFLLESDRLTVQEKEMYRKLINVEMGKPDFFEMSDSMLMGSLNLLSSLLYQHFSQKVIVLIDEYDVPLAKANENNYYDQMVTLIRGLFDQTLKTNDSLYFSVMTGCLRVAKESIFTGLNNLKVLSVLNVQFDEFFGFTDEEVKDMLDYYGLTERYEVVKEWYDGYCIGNRDIYCPWDVISYCDELRSKPLAAPRDYWSNTSGNDIVRHFIEMQGNGITKGEIEALIAGETVIKEIREELTYNQLYDSIDNLWSVLFMTGYLTQRGMAGESSYCLTIPNREIRRIFTRQILSMFKEDVSKDGETLKAFCNALQSGDAAETERLFSAYLSRTVGVRDTFVRKPVKENFYHGILLGILGFKGNWYVRSNRESGDGYSDILIEAEDEEIGIIIEVKYAERGNYDATLGEAFRQIEENHYEEELRREGYETIYKYGIACYKRKCRVVLG
ncbi:MAG: ATP-binding protein, partial [Lachnospiraceae bacterium]|nr:ATP-binding protein [Lachnospiraceae bacterium]